MTQEAVTDQSEPSRERRVRGSSKPFPIMSLEEALQLSKAIMQHGINGEIQRLTLLSRMNKSPQSSATRRLIGSSYKYGLTTGSYSSTGLAVTDDGQTILNQNCSVQERKRKQFELAIERFAPFSGVYERLKNQRLPDTPVLNDEFGRFDVADSDRRKAAEVFTANARYIGLIEQIAGSDHVRTIEDAISQLESNIPAESTSSSLPVESPAPATESRAPATESPAPATESPAPATESRAPATESPAPVPSEEISAGEPTVHIDIQIHIDASATAEQIDQVFRSMARHLYGRGG